MNYVDFMRFLYAIEITKNNKEIWCKYTIYGTIMNKRRICHIIYVCEPALWDLEVQFWAFLRFFEMKFTFHSAFEIFLQENSEPKNSSEIFPSQYWTYINSLAELSFSIASHALNYFEY